MFPHGREALLQAPSVAGALQQVATEGWTGEARAHAAAALLAMSDKQPHVDHGQHNRAQGHIMLSCECTNKPLMLRTYPDHGVICRSVGCAGGGEIDREGAAEARLQDVVWCAAASISALLQPALSNI